MSPMSDQCLIIRVMLLLVIFGSASSSFAAPAGMPCEDIQVQAQRSLELQKIRDADQADRAWQKDLEKGKQPSQETLENMASHDLQRRMRIGEIFGEGCLKSAADYEAAFIVYQHGNTANQYFQAFLWSQQALALGDTHVKGDVATAMDRYLVSTGQKELFGTQAIQPTLGGCWCIQPVEESFPQSLRDEYRGGKNTAYTGLAYLKKLNGGNNCPAAFCDTKLKPTPKGSVPGFW